MTETPFHPELQCFVEGVAYNFVQRCGIVHISDSGCTDMGGCIAFFVRIDPAVRRIETFSDSKPDTIYQRGGDGQWVAL